jgi:hypothetical protein
MGLAYYVSGVCFVIVSWLPIGRQCLRDFPATHAWPLLAGVERYANCTQTSEKMSNAPPATLSEPLAARLSTCIMGYVSPSDDDFVIGPCRLQRPGTTAGNRQQ